jgi:membrane protease YdiL (CAAX protease family)
MLTALLGIPIYAFIAVALGVFGSNPLEQQQAHKVKPAFVYLFMTLSGLYVYAVVTPDLLQRVIFIVLALLLAFALWQKARDQLPYLLDPDASPPSRVSTADGLIAAMVFFVLQAITLMIIAGSSAGITGIKVLLAFCIAGGLTYALMRWVYKRAGTLDVPRWWSEAPNRALLGIAAGLAAGAVAVIYLYFIHLAGWVDNAMAERSAFIQLGWWVLPLALIAAPIFEEFIFRGIVFGGLRRSFGLMPAALASAAIFAVMHPAVSIAPVFLLGVVAALVYERSRSLLAPMLTHATYNACATLGAQYLVY